VTSQFVLVAHAVVKLFDQKKTECHGSPEAGGILIGAYRGPHLELSGFTLPGPKDVRQLTRFIKQDPLHQRAATAAWRVSGRKDTNIGEWHTHPSGDPIPSSIDRRSWCEIVQQGKRTMIFSIIAPNGWQLFWCQKRWTGISILPLVLTERGQTGFVFRPKTIWRHIARRMG
jgi:integrative and conjugative element protein (TIGR02256 family)